MTVIPFTPTFSGWVVILTFVGPEYAVEFLYHWTLRRSRSDALTAFADILLPGEPNGTTRDQVLSRARRRRNPAMRCVRVNVTVALAPDEE